MWLFSVVARVRLADVAPFGLWKENFIVLNNELEFKRNLVT